MYLNIFKIIIHVLILQLHVFGQKNHTAIFVFRDNEDEKCTQIRGSFQNFNIVCWILVIILNFMYANVIIISDINIRPAISLPYFVSPSS